MTSLPNTKRVIITRPAQLADGLHACLLAKGYESIVFPTLDINSKAYTLTRQDYDIAIFTSPNAVLHGYQLAGLLPQAAIATIGRGTQRQLQAYSVEATILPAQAPYNSEALLQHPSLQDVSRKNILIICGKDGRTLLSDTLQQRGANVELATVYQRTLPDYDPAQFKTLFEENSNTTIVSTSQESLANLCTMAKACDAAAIYRLQLCVISPRMAAYAEWCGFEKPAIVAASAVDEDVLAVF